MTTDNDWIGEKILASEDKLLEILQGEVSGSDTDAPSIDLTSFPEPTPLDPEAENQAFADLLKFLAANPDDDCEATVLSMQEFSESTAPATDIPSQET